LAKLTGMVKVAPMSFSRFRRKRLSAGCGRDVRGSVATVCSRMEVAIPPKMTLVALPSGNAVWAPLILLRVRQRMTEGGILASGSVWVKQAPDNLLCSDVLDRADAPIRPPAQ